jgi:hypothetical protein
MVVVVKRNKLRKRSPQLPILPFLIGDLGGSDAKKLTRGHLGKAIDLIEVDLWRRVRECDEPEGRGAAELLVLILRVRYAIRHGDAEAAALWGLKVGVTIQEFEYRFNYGSALKRGFKFEDALLFAAERKATSNQPRNTRMAKEFLKRQSSWDKGKTALMAAIGKQQVPTLGRSASIDAINKGLKKIVRSKAKPD